MIRILKTFFLLLVINTFVFGQINPGARQIALSNSDFALADDIFAIFNNPAGLAQINWRELGVYYSPAPFALKELANGYGGYTEPIGYGNVSVGFMTYGFDLYKESKFALSYAHNLLNKYFFGLTIQYQNLKIERYGNDNTVTLTFGGLAYILDDLRVGFSIENLLNATYGNEDDQIPRIFNAAISYNYIDDLSLNLAISKEKDFRESIRFGLEYLIIQYLYLRAGINNYPSTFSGGIGINYSLFSLDYAVTNHEDLGVSHQIGLIVHFSDFESRHVAKKNFLGIK